MCVKCVGWKFFAVVPLLLVNWFSISLSQALLNCRHISVLKVSPFFWETMFHFPPRPSLRIRTDFRDFWDFACWARLSILVSSWDKEHFGLSGVHRLTKNRLLGQAKQEQEAHSVSVILMPWACCVASICGDITKPSRPRSAASGLKWTKLEQEPMNTQLYMRWSSSQFSGSILQLNRAS